MRILAIDPGYERLGIAILEKEKSGKEQLVYSETFKTPTKDEFVTRLFALGQRIEGVIGRYEPTALAIEKLFFNTNQKTALQVSEARGVIIYAAQKHGLAISEYTPLQIKTAVAGYGRADKNQVINMVTKLINIPETGDDGKKIKRHDDEYDAIGCGLTYFAVNPNR